MRSFNKMVKDKRIKVLTFVILLLGLNGVYSVNNLNVPSLFHFVKSGGNSDEGLCIAFDEEVYSAIEWTYPIPEDETDLPETVSSYLPSEPSVFDCTFEEDEECNKIWNLKNWIIPIHSSKNYLPISDTRWEGFKTYLTTNKTKISENRFEIPNNSNLGISIRSGNSVDILLCEGYNPETYPCYKITLGNSTKNEVFIKKEGINETLFAYKSNFPILSSDEWKNFNLSLSKAGQIQLKEISKESLYVNLTDSKPLNTLYLLMNSSLPSLWKIHKNNFLYTNVSQSTRFGPPMNVTGSTICLSMYIMMCENCFINFYKIKDMNTDLILNLSSTQEDTMAYNWKFIKITLENATDDTVEFFVKTESNSSDKFWAIDNIRSCINDEFKIRKISQENSNRKMNFKDPSVSCHSHKLPQWRPKMQLIITEDLPIINDSRNSTSIQLSWKSPYQQPFLINFKGSDICSSDTIPQFKNKFRLKSNGWVVVKPKEKTVTIENLVPYTHYSLFFIDPVYGRNKSLSASTNPTEKPKLDELPLINILPKAQEAEVNISPRKCNVTYGPILYGLDVVQHPNYSLVIDENTRLLTNLTPYTNYTLTVQIARTISGLNNTATKIVKYYDFTTKPDVAPQLDFVEIYEVSESSASFRYTLPTKVNGRPMLIQVRSCSKLLRECAPQISNITSCQLWENLFCVTIDGLIKKTLYTFALSIKNNDTNAFGKEVQIERKTMENVPGTPTNLSYNVVSCTEENETCNLNVSWSHPYNQNGAITSFEISLYENGPKITDNVNIEKQYLPVYSHLIRYLPFAKTYNVSIRACNTLHKGTYASMLVQIDHIADHIDQTPKIIKQSSTSATFQIPKLDYRLNSSSVIAIVQRKDNLYADMPQRLVSISKDSLCLANRTTWLAGTWKMSPMDVINITVGNNDKIFSDLFNDTVVNKPLSPNTNYCINFVIKSIYKNVEHTTIYYKNFTILPENPSKPPNTWEINTIPEVTVTSTMSTWLIITLTLLLVLLVAAIAVVSILLHRKRVNIRNRPRSDAEHIYEAITNEDYNDSYNVVYNATYDKLNHD